MRFIAASLIVSVGSIVGIAGCAVTVSPTPRTPPRASAPPPHAHAAWEDTRLFYDALDPYGDWVRVEPYGWVWAPGAVDPFWRPYTVGRWIWTDYGWTWVSTERWGWACYHYGRWARVPRHGWVWVPGTVWAPAWVAWRGGPGVVGWAPLPPEVGFRAEAGIDLGAVDLDVVIRSDFWCFVDEAHVFEPNVVRHAYPVGRNVTVIPRTSRALRIDVSQGRVVNHGVDDQGLEHRLGRAVPRYRVVDEQAEREREASIRGEEVRMWRPPVREAPPSARPPRAFERPVVTSPPPRGARDRDSASVTPVPPVPPAPPAVERRIDRGWDHDWRRLQEMQKKDDAPAARQPARSPAPPALEREREENYRAAENAYREQQAHRARVLREAEKPRPDPSRSGRSAGVGKQKPKDEDKGRGKAEKDTKDTKGDGA